MNSLLINDSSSVLTPPWFPTFDRFGPNGTGAAKQRGQTPNYPGPQDERAALGPKKGRSWANSVLQNLS